MTSIKNFIEAEEKKMTWLDKVVRNYPQVYQTSFLSLPMQQSTAEIVLRPSIVLKLITVPFILLCLLFYFYLFRLLINQNLPVFVPVAGILFVSFMLAIIIWYSFLNPKYIYRIRINHEFLEAQDRKYNWKDVSETCILSKMAGRNSNSYLIIIMKDGSFKKLNLLKFRISDKRLAGIVEFYKK
jgi:hypothetical protein